jgi:hypothetical protein
MSFRPNRNEVLFNQYADDWSGKWEVLYNGKLQLFFKEAICVGAESTFMQYNAISL